MLPVLFAGLLAVISQAVLAAGPTPVRVARLDAIAVYPTHSAPATVISGSEAELSAELAARIIAFPPAVGDVIEKGATIARLDCRDYQLELAAARADLVELEARLELAERRLERARELTARQSLAVEVLDERNAERAVARAQIAAARARIERDEVAVSRCVVTSPFRAVLLERLAPLGQYTAVGEAVARVIDLDDIELSAQVGADDVDAIEATTSLDFVAGGRRYPVSLRVAVAAITTATRARELRLRFTGARPLSGTAGELEWRDARPHVPGSVLVQRGEALGLFVVAEARARFTSLPAAQAGRPSAVALPDDALIVTEGQYGLNDGDSVTLLEE